MDEQNTSTEPVVTPTESTASAVEQTAQTEATAEVTPPTTATPTAQLPPNEPFADPAPAGGGGVQTRGGSTPGWRISRKRANPNDHKTPESHMLVFCICALIKHCDNLATTP